MKVKYLLPVIISILFAAACARQTSPTGGPKDTIPPKLISSNPKNEQTNFNGRTLELEFTEAINLNSAKEQVIITPSIGKDYEIKSKKNSVVVEMNTQLDSNTTYTVNFREAVQDITEKNPVKNLKLAFSTGNYVDSISLSGVVTDLITATPKKDVTVALQHDIDTLSIMKHPSFYFTRTNDKGEFKLDYLKPGLYYIYTYEDKNKNLVVDSRNEGYGFLAKPIDATKDSTKIQLGIFRLDTRPLKLTSARPYNTYFNVKASKNLRSFKASSKTAEDVTAYWGEDQQNIRVYNTFDKTDSVDINLTLEDSLGQRLDTIVYAKFRQEENIDKEKFTMSVLESKITARNGNIKVTYKFNKPIKEFNLDSIYFKKDSLTVINFTPADANYDPELNEFYLTKTVDKKIFLIEERDPSTTRPKGKNDTTNNKAPKILNELYTRKAAFISIENDSSARETTKITPSQPNNLSEIFFKIKSTRNDILVQLLTPEFKVIQQIPNAKQGSFKDLPADDYIIRYVIDTNRNNRWDPGNYLNRTEPEKFYYSKDPKGTITQKLKANWELELAEMLISD